MKRGVPQQRPRICTRAGALFNSLSLSDCVLRTVHAPRTSRRVLARAALPPRGGAPARRGHGPPPQHPPQRGLCERPQQPAHWRRRQQRADGERRGEDGAHHRAVVGGGPDVDLKEEPRFRKRGGAVKSAGPEQSCLAPAEGGEPLEDGAHDVPRFGARRNEGGLGRKSWASSLKLGQSRRVSRVGGRLAHGLVMSSGWSR